MKLTEELNIVSFFLGLTAFLQPMQQSTRKCVHLGSVDVLYAFCMTVSNEFVQQKCHLLTRNLYKLNHTRSALFKNIIRVIGFERCVLIVIVFTHFKGQRQAWQLQDFVDDSRQRKKSSGKGFITDFGEKSGKDYEFIFIKRKFVLKQKK